MDDSRLTVSVTLTGNGSAGGTKVTLTVKNQYGTVLYSNSVRNSADSNSLSYTSE